jgi:O-antigen/teichoic acid export membrane protein
MSGAGPSKESQTTNASAVVDDGVLPLPPDAEAGARGDGRYDGVSGSLRRHTARGTIINSAFQVGLAVLLLLRRLIVAAFLTASEVGLWGVILIALLTVMFLKDVGIGDKFVQQDEPNQEHAFQKAFTSDLLLSVATMALAVATLPLFASVYDKPEIVVPGLVLSAAIVGNGLQSPAWIYYRRMDFVRQRSLLAVEPVVTFAVTVALAVAGMGYWALVIGAVVGSWTGGLVALWICPYPIRLRLQRGTLREYFSFSWPIAVASGGGIIIAQGSLLVATRAVGLAAAGAIALASAITGFSEGIDSIVSRTLYPAICAVRDRTELMFEAFEKSNRVALMWGVPFGLGVALFAPDLVNFVIGHRWHFAIPVIQAFALVAAADQLGFNWTVFLRALDRTRPLAVLAVLQAGAFLVIAVPLMIVDGLNGFAVGWMTAAAVTISARMFLLARLFSGFRVLRHAFRGIAPVLPAAAVIGLARALEPTDRSLGLALAELALYVVVVAAATWAFERPLIRELLGYLHRRAAAAASIA